MSNIGSTGHDSSQRRSPAPHGYLKGTGIPAPAPDTPPVTDWIRVKDATARFGIGRTRLYSLIEEGKIKSVSLRNKEQPHGTRLICLASLQAYLETLWQEAKSSSKQEGGAA